MNLSFVTSITAAFEKTTITEIEIKHEGQFIRLVKPSSIKRDVSNSVSPENNNQHISIEPVSIVAPAVGIIRFCHATEQTPFASVGSDVIQGDTVAFIERGTQLLPIRASVSGKLTNRLVEDGDVVGFSQPIFALDC